MAVADMLSRYGDSIMGKSGYSRVCAMAAASSPDSLRNLRGKYKQTFLLVDGLDYPSGNAKNCSYPFDKLGHGAAACGGSCIAAAWREEGDGSDYLEKAKLGAQRMQKNLTRYITVL
jgi:orotidine-5'-phosphate decarboxylase